MMDGRQHRVGPAPIPLLNPSVLLCSKRRSLDWSDDNLRFKLARGA